MLMVFMPVCLEYSAANQKPGFFLYAALPVGVRTVWTNVWEGMNNAVEIHVNPSTCL